MSARIHIDRLSFYRGARAVLRDIDVPFESGRITAVLGPNGAGKSTLLACIAGLLQPSSGAIRLGDEDVQRMNGAYRARQIAFLPQAPEIAWPLDVQNFVALGRIPHQRIASADENSAAVARAMDSTATTPWARRIVTELSGGERTRVLLARALASETHWILADEPFTGLDPNHQLAAAELLRNFTQRGGGVVLTSHDLSLAARIADRIVLLHEGQIVADGSAETALSPDNLRAVYGVDTEWLIAGTRHRTPIIAIHGRHAR